MSPFETAPEFITEDNRTARSYNPVSAEQMVRKHESLLPPALVRGKTVLDLGCAIGATGHWVLSHGATRYTGIEMQNKYADTAQLLLEKYHTGKSVIARTDVLEWLGHDSDMHDIICLFGVIHTHVDYYSLLRISAQKARSIVAIEELYPKDERAASAAFFSSKEGVNLADEDASLSGRGVRMTPAGLSFILEGFGFSGEGPLNPEKSEFRYRMRYTRTGKTLTSAMEDAVGSRAGARTDWRT